MTYNVCERHQKKYSHVCWMCDYEDHLPPEYVHGWNDRMTNALIVNQRAHDAIMRDLEEAAR